jgi:UPF0755 protein
MRDHEVEPGLGDAEPADVVGGRRAAREAARAERRRRRRRNAAALGIALGLLAPFVGAGGWFAWQLDPPGGPRDRLTVDVAKGWGVSEIADELERRGVIGSALAFRIYSGVTSAGPFQAGPYRLREHLGVRDAIDVLEAGPFGGTGDVELTLPPGLTLEQIADRVGDLPGRDREAFLAAARSGTVRSRYQPPEATSLEGLLYPETYRIGKQEDETAILRKLVEQFDLEADAVGLANAPAVIGRTPYEAAVWASLIEREAGVEEDRPLISAVIRNRLRDGMLLQIDAVLCYAKGGCTEPLTNADKQIDSPYNVYRVPGLPPTPISSVSEASLRAALAPEDVPFKFYVLFDESGRHKFAETQEEHERNVAEARDKGLL